MRGKYLKFFKIIAKSTSFRKHFFLSDQITSKKEYFYKKCFVFCNMQFNVLFLLHLHPLN